MPCELIFFSPCRESSIQDLDECLENVYNCLDDVWKIEEIKYPQNRMEHLLDVVGNGVVKSVQRTTSNMDIWAGDHGDNIDLLKMCQRACDKWNKTCEQLTVLYWSNYSYHKWTGPKHSPENLIAFSDRIDQVRRIIRIKIFFKKTVLKTIFFLTDNIDIVRE